MKNRKTLKDIKSGFKNILPLLSEMARSIYKNMKFTVLVGISAFMLSSFNACGIGSKSIQDIEKSNKALSYPLVIINKGNDICDRISGELNKIKKQVENGKKISYDTKTEGGYNSYTSKGLVPIGNSKVYYPPKDLAIASVMDLRTLPFFLTRSRKKSNDELYSPLESPEEMIRSRCDVSNKSSFIRHVLINFNVQSQVSGTSVDKMTVENDSKDGFSASIYEDYPASFSPVSTSFEVCATILTKPPIINLDMTDNMCNTKNNEILFVVVKKTWNLN